MDTKKVIPTITDCDSGEIIYQLKIDADGTNGGFPYKTFNIGDFPAAGESFCQRIFDSFLRGVKQGRNLCLMITVRDYKQPEQASIF